MVRTVHVSEENKVRERAWCWIKLFYLERGKGDVMQDIGGAVLSSGIYNVSH